MRRSSDTSEAPTPLPTRRPLWAGYGRKTNRMATASLVFAILWLGGVGSVAAVLCGHRGRRQIGRRWERGRGRATLGIRLGWLGIVASGVVAVLSVYTPEQLAHQFDLVERVLRRIFAG